MFYMLSRITFEVLKVAMEEVDIVEIGKESSRLGWQFAELVFILINILWFWIRLFIYLLSLTILSIVEIGKEIS